MYPESITVTLSNLRHKVLAVIDSVAKTFESEVAPFSAATAGINACQLLLCQLSGVSLIRNHGGIEINKYLPESLTYGSYIRRNSESFCSVARAGSHADIGFRQHLPQHRETGRWQAITGPVPAAKGMKF